MSRTISTKIKKNWVSDAYGDLSDGQARTGRQCGKCFKKEVQGEQSQNACPLAVIRKAHGLEYNCFKPSCELGGGVIRNDGWTRVSIHSSDSEPAEHTSTLSQEHALPKDFTSGITGTRASWLAGYGLNAVDVARYGIGECGSDPKGLYFPVEDLHGDYSGYLRRDVEYSNQHDSDQRRGIKWVNRTKPGTLFFSKPRKAGGVAFIVEDAVSAIRVGRIYSTAALGRVYLGPDAQPTLLKWYNLIKPSKVIIALDRDVDHIAKSFKKDLTMLIPCVSVLNRHKVDPKNWTEEEVHDYAR